MNDYVELARRSDNDRLTASVLGIRVWMLALSGDLDEADALVAELKDRFTAATRADQRGSGFLIRAEARLRLQQDRPGDALAALVGVPEDALGPWGWWASSGVEARARLGDVAGTQRIVETMRALDSPLAEAMAHQALGLVRLVVGEPRSAAVELAAAVRGFEALRAPYLMGCAGVDLARALADDDPVAAVEHARAAVAIFAELGAKRDLQRGRQALADLGVVAEPPRRAPRRSGPLSPRELEVAALVAEGLTNGEIADRLTLSVRTVTSHLDHIYARLGINGRAALARYVIQDEPSALV